MWTIESVEVEAHDTLDTSCFGKEVIKKLVGSKISQAFFNEDGLIILLDNGSTLEIRNGEGYQYQFFLDKEGVF